MEDKIRTKNHNTSSDNIFSRNVMAHVTHYNIINIFKDKLPKVVTKCLVLIDQTLFLEKLVKNMKRNQTMKQ
jgi:hypothetical protein